MHAKPTPPSDLPPVVWQVIPVAADAGPLGAFVLHDPDALLEGMNDETFNASDQRMPYYALLWPAGEALARAVAEGPALTGRAALDLGCGCGAVGFAAARRGALVTLLDWAPEAAALVHAGAEHLGLAVKRFVCADWRDPPAELGGFFRILAADVLYEARNAVPVAAFLAEHLTEDGEAWISDPGRHHARDFPAQAQQAGLELVEQRTVPAAQEGSTVTLFRLRLRPRE